MDTFEHIMEHIRDVEVFVVEKGMRHDGGGCVGVFQNLEAANSCAKYHMDKETTQIERFIQSEIEEGATEEDARKSWEGHGVFQKWCDDVEHGHWCWEDRTTYVCIMRRTAERVWTKPEED